MSKIGDEFTRTIEFGNTDVDVVVEWSADTDYLEYMEVAVSLAHLRLDSLTGKPKTLDGQLCIDFVDIIDVIPKELRDDIYEECQQDARSNMADDGDLAYDTYIDNMIFEAKR